ncbi:MAG: hypothetical protein K2G70_03725 [Turicibacter sp.]|nr:hypothetical protein [Turicibacter sp.]
MKRKEELSNHKTGISSTIHHSFKLTQTEEEEKRKIYFARLRGYRDRR